MTSCVETVLYLYPRLEELEKDYEDHIMNKAVLSHGGREDATALAEYIASQVIEKRKFMELHQKLDRVWARLTDEEKELVLLRYGRRRKIPALLKKKQNGAGRGAFNEKNCARRLASLHRKLRLILSAAGLTKEKFLAEYGEIALVGKIYEGMERLRKKCKAQSSDS